MMSGHSDSSRSPVSSGSTPSTANDTSHTASTPATQPIPKKSQQIKTDKPRPHMCTVCTRAFARLEHLKRHERSHTNEKPFQCAACGRCFARRDLVLRHQQKLHTTIPNIMRRGSTKDLDEHIIVLHNNTENSAPLPNGVTPDLGDDANEDTDKSADSRPTQLYSPPKTNEFTYSSSMAPQFRTQLFGQQHMSPENNIPSPIPTNSSQNTPPNSHNPQPGNSNIANALPAYLQQEQANTQLNHILGSQTRHASFSAVSGTSYTNLKDAGEDGQPELGFQLTDELTSKNLLLSGLDLTSLGVLDWANLDSLDLSSAADKNKGAGSPTFSQLTAKQRSLKNLQQFFQMGGNLKTPTPGAAPAGQNQSQTPNQSAFAAFQFNNPNHPHHLKGMTPFEYGMNPPNFMNLSTQSMIPENTDPLVLQGEVVEAKKAQNKQKRESTASESPSKKLKSELSPQNGSKQKVHPISITMTHDDDWLKEIINTPYETNFPLASHQIGFIETPSLISSPKLNSQQAPTLMSSNTDYSSLGEISSLFRSRQIDLVKQMNPHLNENDVPVPSNESGQQDLFSFITEEFRTRIIDISNITDGQFPKVSDLNHYMRLYELEFNKYFPFIHLPSLNPSVNKYEDIPLILSMASIGALYAYHDTNTLLLFSLSKYHIQKFFENEITLDNFQFKKVPLMTHQCLVLHIFITMFFDEPNMIEITHKQIKSMVGLMKSTEFNKPLEHLIMPPAEYLGPNLDPAQIQKSYDYFIMAQSRIRTVHIFYSLQNFRSSFMGLPVYFDSSLLSNGSYCSDESLWHTHNAKDWYSKVSILDTTLISLSNGAQFNDLVQKLPNNMVNRDASFCQNNLFGILMYIHGKIQSSSETHNPFNSLGWTVNVKPQLDRLIKSWELKFLSNGGILNIDSSNYEILTIQNEFKLILPLYNLVKIKVVINLNPILFSIFQKNWNEMNAKLNVLSQQELKHEKLKQTMPYCAEIIKIWIFNIKNLDNKDVKQYSLRSPIFFVSCIYVAILIMSSYLNYLEKKVERGLSEFELVHWIECESILGQVEQVLSPILKSSYSEILTKQGNTFKYIKQDDGLKRVNKLIEERDRRENLTEKEHLHFDNEIGKEILTDKLSIKSLYLGIRILADAPVWPIAMGLAESFKDRANYLCEQ